MVEGGEIESLILFFVCVKVIKIDINVNNNLLYWGYDFYLILY